MKYKGVKIYNWRDLVSLDISRIRFIKGSPLIIGGGYNNSSPPIISSLTAYASGVEKVYSMVPSKIFDIARHNIDLIIYPFPDQKITRGVAKKIIKLIGKRKVSPSSVLIGPGITGIWKEVGFLASKLLDNYNFPIIIDKDAVKNEIFRLHHSSRDLLLIINNKVLLSIFNYRYASLQELYDKINDIVEKHNVKIIYADDNALIFSDENGNLVVKNPDIFKLKYYDSYIFSGLIAGISAKLDSLYESSILAVKIYINTFASIYREIGISYSFIDVFTYLKKLFRKFID